MLGSLHIIDCIVSRKMDSILLIITATSVIDLQDVTPVIVVCHAVCVFVFYDEYHHYDYSKPHKSLYLLMQPYC